MKRGSTRKLGRRSFLKGALATAPLLLGGPSLLKPARALAHRGLAPSTTTEPYLVPTLPGVRTIPILTTGDSIRGYRMVGIPDGLGAFNSDGHDFTLIMNHELLATNGIARGHGSKGAFVSRWKIDRRTLEVLKGEDFTSSPEKVFLWDMAAQKYVPGTTVWERHCSADLPKPGAFWHQGKGTLERIYMNGEEVSGGRAWARIATGPHSGEAWQLPRLGHMAYENCVASPFPQRKTIVMLTDDGNLSTAGVASAFPSEVYMYVGTKTNRGSVIDRAGLTNGSFYGLKITVGGKAVAEESNEFGLGNATSGFVGSGRFSFHNFGDVSALSALELEQASIDAGVTRLQRPEDGAWDPRRRHSEDFYFVTTASLTLNCRLWRLRFDDIERPEQGGTIEILLKGTEGHGMLDNVTIDRLGRIVMDEDPGNNARVSKVWAYQIATGEFVEVAHHNPAFFDPANSPSPAFITADEETSGIIDAAHILGDGWFLLDVQAHKVSTDTELVEGGQLLAVFIDPDIAAPPRHGHKHDHDDHDDRDHDHDDDKD
ncbi:MAG TPA: phytase [Methylomirabilota bacterium]|nr:phytase [Methylomirabilota bacterium]